MSDVDKLPIPADAGAETGSSSTAGEAWRVFGIMSEFVEATERLSRIRPAVSIFGSARVANDSLAYRLTQVATGKLEAGHGALSVHGHHQIGGVFAL